MDEKVLELSEYEWEELGKVKCVINLFKLEEGAIPGNELKNMVRGKKFRVNDVTMNFNELIIIAGRGAKSDFVQLFRNNEGLLEKYDLYSALKMEQSAKKTMTLKRFVTVNA